MWAPSGQPGCEVEEERTEVLHAVARRMLDLDRSASDKNPEVQMCIDLLTHLASPPLARAATAK